MHPSPLSFSFRARGLRFAVLESVRIESPPRDVLEPDVPSQETADAVAFDTRSLRECCCG